MSAFAFAFACQVSSASANVCPWPWMQKSTWHVVPPNAADVWPDSKSSIVTVPPNGMSRCVCGSMQPGRTYFPLASIVRSTVTSSSAPMSATRSPSTRTSATKSSAAVTTRPPLISTDMAGLYRGASYSHEMPLDPSRTVAELKELRELGGDENGAQRVAWTETWERGRAWLREKVASTGAAFELDEAGNQWFTLPGRSEQALLIGGHMDSVPNGGWLDGCLNVLAGVEVLRRVAGEG